ncbi:MAG: hypothetical protein QNJ11_05280 [Woeseiaceae bacterium]|nr:hypothetical protein [Woeseiaceae bacterium]
MPDSKQMRWAERFGTDAEQDAKKDDGTVANDQPAANDADGWQQYRRWISKAPAPRGRRSGIDPSLYSWKGYRDWTDQVRRNWAKEALDDKD